MTTEQTKIIGLLTAAQNDIKDAMRLISAAAVQAATTPAPVQEETVAPVSFDRNNAPSFPET